MGKSHSFKIRKNLFWKWENFKKELSKTYKKQRIVIEDELNKNSSFLLFEFKKVEAIYFEQTIRFISKNEDQRSLWQY